MIAMYRVDDVQAWEKQGNFKNYMFALQPCASRFLLPFMTENFTKSTGNACNTFQLRRVKFVNKKKSVLETTTLIKTAVLVSTATSTQRIYYDASVQQPEFVEGIYEYYMTDTAGNVFISDPFFIPNTNELLNDSGDFNNDFNDDFLI